MRSLLLGTSGDGQEKLEFWGQLVFGVESVGEVNTTDSAVSVDLNSKQYEQISDCMNFWQFKFAEFKSGA